MKIVLSIKSIQNISLVGRSLRLGLGRAPYILCLLVEHLNFRKFFLLNHHNWKFLSRLDNNIRLLSVFLLGLTFMRFRVLFINLLGFRIVLFFLDNLFLFSMSLYLFMNRSLYLWYLNYLFLLLLFLLSNNYLFLFATGFDFFYFRLFIVNLLSFLLITNPLDINIDDIIKSFSQLPFKLQIAVKILLKEILIASLRQGAQYNTRTVFVNLQRKHILFDKLLLQLHQIIDLQIAKSLIVLVAIVHMPDFVVWIWEIIVLVGDWMPLSLDVIAIDSSLLTDEM